MFWRDSDSESFIPFWNCWEEDGLNIDTVLIYQEICCVFTQDRIFNKNWNYMAIIFYKRNFKIS